tara:strand:- start:47 stop:262 length:216 start_codon:yes stop_codon:yes gene_type:complete
MKDIEKLIIALETLKVGEYTLRGDFPTDEASFNKTFKINIGVTDDGQAIESSDPSKFGVTWTQIKAEMDKL